MGVQLANGVFPTMITPFTETGTIDYSVLEKLIEWYLERGVDGLFAVCQSSEMFHLSLKEKVELTTFIKNKSEGRVPVIASGHTSERFEDQVEELNNISDAGVDALVLITNRLASQNESDDVFLANLEQLLASLSDHVSLGFYECPFPYKRILSPKVLKWCADTGRFSFLKDTSCDVNNIKEKMESVEGKIKIYNANSATLLDTLRLGVAGYSGVMANFHPELYSWLINNYRDKPAEAERLSDMLSLQSLIEKQEYPINAKYFLMLDGVMDNYVSRTKNSERFTQTNRIEVEQLYRISKKLTSDYII